MARDVANTLTTLGTTATATLTDRVTQLAGAAVSVGIMQGQICTLAERLAQGSLPERMLGALKSKGMLKAVAATALGVTVWTGPNDTRAHLEETAKLLNMGVAVLVEAAPHDLGSAFDQEFRAQLNLPPLALEFAFGQGLRM